jgi:hypothetical protein
LDAILIGDKAYDAMPNSSSGHHNGRQNIEDVRAGSLPSLEQDK